MIRGLHQRGPPVDAVLLVHVGALLHHELHHFQLAAHRRHHEGRRPLLIGRVHLGGVLLQDLFDQLRIPWGERIHTRSGWHEAGERGGETRRFVRLTQLQGAEDVWPSSFIVCENNRVAENHRDFSDAARRRKARRGEEMEINKFTTQFVPYANNTGPDYREKNRMFKTWFDLLVILNAFFFFLSLLWDFF